ncbi:hypothetical protein F5B17DRAFT_74630 [Nemania serpens]|nr:hypothetical protein F5B17DRAFT_74630 [Nemania serpens]
MTQRDEWSLIFGTPACQTASRHRLFIWTQAQKFELLTHIRNHPYPEEKYDDLDTLLVRLDLDGYGPEITNLDGERVCDMIERKVKSKIRDMRKQLMRVYVPFSPMRLPLVQPRQPQQPQQFQQQPLPQPAPVKQEGEVVGDGHDIKTDYPDGGPLPAPALPPQVQQQQQQQFSAAQPALAKKEESEDYDGFIGFHELQRFIAAAGWEETEKKED